MQGFVRHVAAQAAAAAKSDIVSLAQSANSPDTLSACAPRTAAARVFRKCLMPISSA